MTTCVDHLDEEVDPSPPFVTVPRNLINVNLTADYHVIAATRFRNSVKNSVTMNLNEH